MSDVFPEISVWPAQPSSFFAVVIDYQALADHMPYEDATLLLDHEHAGLLMEEFMWRAHLHELDHFYRTGVYRR